MRECAKRLRPYDTEISGTTVVDLGKAAIEDIRKHSQAQAGDDGLAAFVVVIGNPAESKRDGNLHRSISPRVTRRRGHNLPERRDRLRLRRSR